MKKTAKISPYLLFIVGLALLAQLLLAPEVGALEKYSVKSEESQYMSWGLLSPIKEGSINIEAAWKNFEKKRDIVVAIVDTGVDPNHPFLKNNLYIPNGKNSLENFGVDFSKNSANKSRPFDDHGHGTHVAGIVKGIFPEVKLLVLKYFSREASGQDNVKSTIDALRYAVEQNVDIINYSGGGPEASSEELQVLKEAERKGIIIIAASGNEYSNIDNKAKAFYPASYGLSNIVTVTAHDQTLNLPQSSNYGKNSVDLSAPGYRIRSSFPFARAGYLTGTSQATAFVTGVAALVKANYPHLSVSQIKRALNEGAKKESTLLGKCVSGGRLDAEKALAVASNLNSPSRALAHEKKGGKIIYRKKR